MLDDLSTAGPEPRIARILRGATDPHVHSGPSLAPRALDHLELARQMSEAGFAAVITKDHDASGVTTALIARHHPGLTTRVHSGVTLNDAVGGMNPYAVEHTAAMGGRVVFLPTLATENLLRWEGTAGLGPSRPRPGRCGPPRRSPCSTRAAWSGTT
jgi:hypothetical protein